jgi:hypothetical protein
MKKLTLKIDELHVESFRVDSDDAVIRGTVFGQSGQIYTCPDSVRMCIVGPSESGCSDEPWNPGESLVTCGFQTTCPTNEAVGTL